MEIAALPKLLPELVAAVAVYLPFRDFASVSSASGTWNLAICVDEFWDVVIRRQWLFTRPLKLGVHFPGGWRQICRCFCTMKFDLWRPPPDDEQGAALERLDVRVRSFLFGIAHGFVPTSDDCFTFHSGGATPIHYRHVTGPGGDRQEEYSETSTLRLGGKWEWSPDREAWFSTGAHDITKGKFAGGGWSLVAENKEIVSFLHRWPLLPLVIGPLRSQNDDIAVPSIVRLNEGRVDDFMNVSVGSMPRPTTTCVATRAFTVHFYFMPALLIECSTDLGWQIAASTRSQFACGPTKVLRDVIDDLKDYDGLAEYILDYEALLWTRLGRRR